MEGAWHEQVIGSNAFVLTQKLKETKEVLKKWNKEHFGLVEETIKKLQEQIDIIQKSEPSNENLWQEDFPKQQLAEWLSSSRDSLETKV